MKSGILTNEEIHDISQELVENLRELTNGTRTTTFLLLQEGWKNEEFDPIDMVRIHEELMNLARINNISLDMLEHDNKMEGLPYNLDYIVHNKDAQFICPYCGSVDTARYVFGMPVMDDVAKRKLKEGKWFLAGCIIGDDYSERKRRCNSCHKDFYTDER